MIIDCHGHYTTTPPGVGAWRDAQKEAVAADPDHVSEKTPMAVTDDEIRESIASNQLKVQQERGTDVTVFSPRASWMGHHVGNATTSQAWTEHCNDLIRRVCDMFPQNFVPVCQLPQSPQTPIESSIAELRRCVEQMGFIGCNLNPDPSGGYWKDRPLGDRYWYPFYETMCELDVPAMIHVSDSCNPNFHFTGAHYLNADTSAFMQILKSDLFERFPKLRFVIPHGGGAVPYHWGRYRGIAIDMKKPEPAAMMSGNLYFDTCVYHQPGIDLLTDVVPVDNVLFASEMHGAVRCADPDTGHFFDDTRRYIEATPHLNAEEKEKVFFRNALKVYPRLKVKAA